jgi:hypothetical protein
MLRPPWASAVIAAVTVTVVLAAAKSGGSGDLSPEHGCTEAGLGPGLRHDGKREVDRPFHHRGLLRGAAP